MLRCCFAVRGLPKLYTSVGLAPCAPSYSPFKDAATRVHENTASTFSFLQRLCSSEVAPDSYGQPKSVVGPRPKAPQLQARVTQEFKGHMMQLTVAGAAPKEYRLQRVRQTRKDKQSREEEAAYNTGYVSYIIRRMKNQLVATFLPVGYPHTVGQNYMSFCVWQFVTNLAVSSTGVISSAFLLYAVGLSGGAAVPTAGALNWVLKDGVGQLGTLLFGKTIAHNFDIHSKTWYFMSTVLLCIAMGIEIMTAVFPSYFLLLGAVANTTKGLSWMAGGSTRSVFNLSFARDNNIADITAKQTSQYIFSSVCGTAAGVVFTSYIQQSTTAAATCFAALSGIAIYSAYSTVKRIPLPTLNPTRLQLLSEYYLGNISLYHQKACSVGPSYFRRAAGIKSGNPGSGAGAAASQQYQGPSDQQMPPGRW